jgi:hypothetical protein
MMKILKLLGMINCKKASQLASDAQERPLSLGEKINVYLHLLICKPCVNFNKQLEFMHRATTSANDNVSMKPDTGMSDSARERIRQQLNQK